MRCQLAELIVVDWRARKADNLARGWHEALQEEVVERRQKLVAGEGTGGAHDQDVLVWRAMQAGHCFFTGCPPNSLRSAAITRIENASLSREVNRANSDCARTPTFTPLSTPSSTVQR